MTNNSVTETKRQSNFPLHSRDCHHRVINLLHACEQAKLSVKVTDEGNYWKTGSEADLRAKFEEHDQTIAAFGGALKDAADANQERVQGPIFSDPRFERLAAEGRAVLREEMFEALHLPPRPELPRGRRGRNAS